MKLHQDPLQALNTVTGYGPGYVEVNKVRHEQSVIIAPEGEILAWPVSRFDALEPSHFENLRALDPEVVIFGSGARLRFAHPRLTSTLTSTRIGVDSMDTQAACRTYNILMSEGRRVVLAVLIETEAAE
ncbi:Mth938-like domain-containing protein [Pandoraea apista]|uniref:Mth938-like domain-containing protein n=1 Tax=Pandoraea apista TaxID=93218 RepID=UPI00248F2EEB|nr:Mth938-like domain-containing protein [Pandoraea apista]